MSFTQDLKDLSVGWIVVFSLIAITIVGGIVFKITSTPLQVISKVTDANHIISSYEEFQSIYNTTQDLCVKIAILDSSNVVSYGISKEERILALKNNLSRWVSEYNAKSRMITKNKWKNPNLPHQLNIKTVCEIN